MPDFTLHPVGSLAGISKAHVKEIVTILLSTLKLNLYGGLWCPNLDLIH
jgi:hypothetical protein